MIAPRLKDAILEQFDHLPEKVQQRVLEYANSLALNSSTGSSGRDLLKFKGKISRTDLSAMESAIAEGCERVDSNEW